MDIRRRGEVIQEIDFTVAEDLGEDMPVDITG
jgi:hypothetical protein